MECEKRPTVSDTTRTPRNYTLPHKIGTTPVVGSGPDWPLPTGVDQPSWSVLDATRDIDVVVTVRAGWSYPTQESGFYSLWLSPDLGQTVLLVAYVGQVQPATFIAFSFALPAGWGFAVGRGFEGGQPIDVDSPESIASVVGMPR